MKDRIRWFPQQFEVECFGGSRCPLLRRRPIRAHAVRALFLFRVTLFNFAGLFLSLVPEPQISVAKAMNCPSSILG
jgi:hypothetical protein